MPEEFSPTPRVTSTRYRASAILMLIAFTVAMAYGFHQRNVVKDLGARNAEMATALQQTRAQVDAINAVLANRPSETAAQTIAPPQKASAARPVRHTIRHRAAARKDDPRWQKMQAQLDEQGKAIDATRQDLVSARTELSGSIAKTHEELVALEKKGERNYFEFDIDKAKQFQRAGQVGVRLRKANTKHQFADLELLVDDVQLTKKHVNLYEPVVFYAQDNGRPVELVINQITRNHIRGYVSAPKYSATELASAPEGATAAQPQSAANAGSGLKVRKPN